MLLEPVGRLRIRQTRLRPISKKRTEEMREYSPLIEALCKLCDNRSELSGTLPDWQSNWKVEPHHIEGRSGKRLLDPFNIIMLTRTEHDIEEGKIKGEKHSVNELKDLVREIRSKQGFREVPSG